MEHTTIRNEKLLCLKCGNEFTLKFPMPFQDMTKKIEAFNELHKDCEQTWVEPEVDQSQDVTEKAMWWIANGHVGLSSKTMWNCLMGNKDFPIHHPYDPDDFSRCYKLLETVPEWKKELDKLRKLSTPWNNLVDNWDTLTSMYEKNIKEDWKNSEEIGIFKYMQTLIR